MVTEHLEIERKYDVDEDVPWVDLGSLPGVDSVGPPRQDDLQADYFDTDRLALARAGITLRRRTGGTDAGWHLKVPGGPGRRMEHAEPLGERRRPAAGALLDLVQAWVRDRDLRAGRHPEHPADWCTRCSAPTGEVLAEAADDVVTARGARRCRTARRSATGGSGRSSWSTVPAELIDAAGERDARGRRGTVGVVVQARAGPRRPAGPTGRPDADGLSPASRAGDVVHAHLVEQVDAMINRDWQARHDEPDGVHKMRVATRRLRSALATFRPLLDRQVTDPIRDELKWIAGELGRSPGRRGAARCGCSPSWPRKPTTWSSVRSRPGSRSSCWPTTARPTTRWSSALRLRALLPAARPAGRAGRRAAVHRARRRQGRQGADQAGAQVLRAGREAGQRGRTGGRRAPRRVVPRDPQGGEAAAVRRRVGRPGLRRAGRRPRRGRRATCRRCSASIRTAWSPARRCASSASGCYLDGDNAFTIGRLHALEQTRGDEAIAEFAVAWKALSGKQVRRWLKR